MLVVACGDDGEGGSTSELVDRQLQLAEAQRTLECDCGAGCLSPEDAPSAAEVECFKAFAERHAAEVAPELRCEIAKLEAENACFESADCTDTAAWEACYDVGEDCDDSFTESHEDETDACDDDRVQDAAAP